MAKIRNRLLPVIRDKHYDEFEEGQNSERIAILNIIDTLETKEVDIEKEVIDWWNAYYSSKAYTFEGYTGHYLENSTLIKIAKHFFELGQLNTMKEVDLDKLGEIARHLIAVKEHIEDMRLYEEEWLILEKIGYPERFKTKKGE